MISRKTALIIGEVYQNHFKTQYRTKTSWNYKNDVDGLYDFLFENEYSAWFCNKAKALKEYDTKRELKEFIMKLHTGETQYSATTNWDWDKRRSLGQTYLENLAKDFLSTKLDEKLLNSLELDGYKYTNDKLLKNEDSILDTEEESGLLESLYTSLELEGKDIATHHLKLSTEHYINSKWDDSISNSRKFLETCLREVANSFSVNKYGHKLSQRNFESPSSVRDFLEQEGLLETKEKKSIASIYSLLSNTGSHPYIAEKEQARLLRHLALTLSQFVLLRFEGWLSLSMNK